MSYRFQCNKFPDTVVEEEVQAQPARKKGWMGLKKAQPAIAYKPAVTRKSCRFYALFLDEKGNLTGERRKVHVEGDVDFKLVARAFAEMKVEVEVRELLEAYAADGQTVQAAEPTSITLGA